MKDVVLVALGDPISLPGETTERATTLRAAVGWAAADVGMTLVAAPAARATAPATVRAFFM